MDDSNVSILRFLINLHNLNLKNPSSPATISNIIRTLGYDIHRADFRKLSKILITEKILVKNGMTYDGFNIYEINKKLLEKFIQQQEIYILCHNFWFKLIP